MPEAATGTPVFSRREDAEMSTPIYSVDAATALIDEIDRVFKDLQKTDKMGDYVKFDTVADMIIDIRNKAVKLKV